MCHARIIYLAKKAAWGHSNAVSDISNKEKEYFTQTHGPQIRMMSNFRNADPPIASYSFRMQFPPKYTRKRVYILQGWSHLLHGKKIGVHLIITKPFLIKGGKKEKGV